MRAGPGLGGIQPAQGDYFQAVKGGGHGDYKLITLAPASVQELYEMTVEAFNLADKYRGVVMLLGDGMLGQMMEVVRFRDEEPISVPAKPWAATGTGMKREHNTITSIHLDPSVLEHWNDERQNQYRVIEEMEQRCELYNIEGADVILVAYGSVSRIAKNAIKAAEREGIKLGLLRPISLWPFPTHAFEQVMPLVKAFLVLEMSAGQMLEDVRLTVEGRRPVFFHGRMGGMIPTVKDIMREVHEIIGKREE
jgi:2-oxoglutarate ferredoxin oxidoreductase subunit alpha